MPRRQPPPRTPTNPTATEIAALRLELQALREQLAELGATREEVAELHDDVEALRSEISARGAAPNPARSPLSEKAREACARNAAVARASKDVGPGSGRVKTKAMQKKLQAEAKKLGKG